MLPRVGLLIRLWGILRPWRSAFNSRFSQHRVPTCKFIDRSRAFDVLTCRVQRRVARHHHAQSVSEESKRQVLSEMWPVLLRSNQRPSVPGNGLATIARLERYLISASLALKGSSKILLVCLVGTYDFFQSNLAFW